LSQIIAARAQFAHGELLVVNVVEEQRLHGIDIAAAAPVEFVLDHVEQAAVQTLDEREGFKIEWPHFGLTARTRLRDLASLRIVHD
jgi:hypothetical protein